MKRHTKKRQTKFLQKHCKKGSTAKQLWRRMRKFTELVQ